MINFFKNKAGDGKRQWTYKIGALLLAVLLWFYVTSTQNPVDQRTYNGLTWTPVNLDADLAIISDTPNLQVSVTLSGAAAYLNNIEKSDIVVYSDFNGFGPGSMDLPVEVELRTEFADYVQVARISTATVSVELESVVSRDFEVEVDVTGVVADDYMQMEATHSPTQVNLRSAERYLDMVNRVSVAANVEGLTDNYSERLYVDVWDAAGNNINDLMAGNLPTVEVVVFITAAKATASTLTLPVRLNYVNEPALGYTISSQVIEPSTVVVSGDRARLEALNYILTEPIDLANLTDDISDSVSLVVENGLSLNREQVYVGVRIEPIVSRIFEKDLVLSDNVPEGFVLDILQQSTEIMVYGPQSLIESLQDSDITPYVDCSNVRGGTYSLPVSVALPANVSLESVTPGTIVINVYDEGTEPEQDETEPGEEDTQETATDGDAVEEL